MLCTECKQRPAIEIHTLCWLCLGRRPYIREPRDFTPAPRPTGGPMEFRTKREAEEAAKDRDMRADWEASAALDYERHGYPRAAKGCRRGEQSFREEAARIRALLPGLEE